MSSATTGTSTTALVVGAAFVLGMYACSLYQKQLQLQQHQMYLNAGFHMLDTVLTWRRAASRDRRA
jgi:hypothetical protein